jgi:hypothetical protein
MNEVSRYLAKIGSKGGKRTAASMTQEQRSERARKAALARFSKTKAKGKKAGKRGIQ